MSTNEHDTRVLVTGAAGYIGSRVAASLSRSMPVIGIDIREPDMASVDFRKMDIRDPALAGLMAERRITHVVHLAAVLEDSGDRQRDFDIDVNGTRNVLNACCDTGVRHLTVTSSGAAYGYHADNPPWLDEQDALRGNPEFAYSDHKRQVEELLADYRQRFPRIGQLVLRPGTVLGAYTRNLITNLFMKRRLLALKGSASPFVFIWDEDVVAIIEDGVTHSRTGVYNLAGDGAVTIDELGRELGKPVVHLPVALVRGALRMGKLLGVGRYGPDQVNFLRYRPVLSNRRLKDEFGYQPRLSSLETFRLWARHAREEGVL